jgi:formylglycine-generating enzyme required for sulfatase activity
VQGDVGKQIEAGKTDAGKVETTKQVIPPPPPVAQATSKACAPEFAGKGRSPRAQCFDALGVGGVGPSLVVVAMSGRNFAIMRDETSNGDYARYCASAGCAAPAGSTVMPVVTVSVADAVKYADWLSAQTGARYRLPTDAEWSAAAAASTVDVNAINCVFAMRGTAIRPVGQGSPNDFGLKDVLGNVQEWVSADGGGWRARGGAVGDPLEDCQKAPSRGHPGSPDGKTGFRLVREIK